MSIEVLRKCPFCGCLPETNFEGTFPQIRCSNPDCFAGAQWVCHYSIEKVSSMWNSRAQDNVEWIEE